MTGTPAEADPAALLDPERFRDLIMTQGKPVILRGAARHWPLLRPTIEETAATIAGFDAGRAELFVGKPEIGGRYHYGDDGLRTFNYAREALPFREALDRIVETADMPGRDTLYMGSLTAETYLPGVERLTPLAFVPPPVRPRF